MFTRGRKTYTPTVEKSHEIIINYLNDISILPCNLRISDVKKFNYTYSTMIINRIISIGNSEVEFKNMDIKKYRLFRWTSSCLYHDDYNIEHDCLSHYILGITYVAFKNIKCALEHFEKCKYYFNNINSYILLCQIPRGIDEIEQHQFAEKEEAYNFAVASGYQIGVAHIDKAIEYYKKIPNWHQYIDICVSIIKYCKSDREKYKLMAKCYPKLCNSMKSQKYMVDSRVYVKTSDMYSKMMYKTIENNCILYTRQILGYCITNKDIIPDLCYSDMKHALLPLQKAFIDRKILYMMLFGILKADESHLNILRIGYRDILPKIFSYV